jgi:TRAP-type C4-dicarboxylate transport system permease small subunit
VVYIGAAVVYKDNSHISVTVLEEIFRPGARRALTVIQKLISAAFMGLVGWWSIGMMEFAALQTSPNMLIPMNYIYLVFPVSSALIVLHLAVSIYDDIAGPFRPQEGGEYHEASQAAAQED